MGGSDTSGSMWSAEWVGVVRESKPVRSRRVAEDHPIGTVATGERNDCCGGQTSSFVAVASNGREAPMIGIGGHLAVPPLPHHRAYGSVPRRLGLGRDMEWETE